MLRGGKAAHLEAHITVDLSMVTEYQWRDLDTVSSHACVDTMAVRAAHFDWVNHCFFDQSLCIVETYNVLPSYIGVLWVYILKKTKKQVKREREGALADPGYNSS